MKRSDALSRRSFLNRTVRWGLAGSAVALGGRGAARGMAADEPLLAGVAVVDITPPVGYRMSGYFHERRSTGVKNPLKAKALVLRQGSRDAALVCCDLIGLSVDVSSRARRTAAERSGIPSENILLSATHTHTGPLYHGVLRDHFHAAALAERGEDPFETVDYPGELVEWIAGAISEARGRLRPVCLEVGGARQEGLSFNRRFHMRDGTVRFNPGVGNPDIVRPAGPIDPEVGILFFRDAETGGAIAGVVNFALHLDTVGGTEFAADYPFHFERALRAEQGGEFVLLFGTGACGDINHIDVTGTVRLETEYIGRTLGETVNEKADSLRGVERPDLAMRREIVSASMRRFTPEERSWAREALEQVGGGELPFLEQVRAVNILAVERRGGTHLPLEVQVLQLGPEAALVGLPGEVFVELGLAIKEASPFPVTLVVELCQDSPGYFPTLKAFDEGSYETVNSRITPGGGELLAEAAVDLLRGLAGLDV
jgi:neutral ceramidase